MTKRKIGTLAVALLFALSLLAASPRVVAQKTVEQEAVSAGEPMAILPEIVGKSVPEYATYASENDGMPSAPEPISVRLDVSLNVEETTSFQVKVPQSGLYTLGFSYKAEDEQISALVLDVQINGVHLFKEMDSLELPRMWKDGAPRKDGLGNEFVPESMLYDEYVTQMVSDSSGWSAQPYKIYLPAGEYVVSIRSVSGNCSLEALVLGVPEAVDAYKAPKTSAQFYDGEPIILEGENMSLKNSYWITAKSDNTSASVHPQSETTSRINYVGDNWKKSGDAITWTTPELPAGYYQIGFLARQSAVLNGSTYRWLKIDGQTPFKEAEAIAFPYSMSWQGMTYSDSQGEPYLIYLSEGSHAISLTVTPGAITEVSALLQQCVDDLGEMYMDITMITGETVDIYRDYDLFDNIPDMEERLETILEQLRQASSELETITGYRSNTYSSVINAMSQIVEKMLDNRFSAHRYKSNYYTQYCSLASTLNEMRDMPLDIDRIYLVSPNEEISYDTAGFFAQTWFSLKKFIASFATDYNTISGTAKTEDPLVIWVNWGRDQAQILNSLIQSSFTAQTGIGANVMVVNATVVQAVLSGNGPDCLLQQSRSEPVNLAMRNVLADLSTFDDIDEVLARFQPGADIPYRYNGGLYALPDTQTFYLLYYRQDIFDELGLTVPETWDDFAEVCKLLVRNNLDVWIPYTQITDMSQVNTGVGSLSLFPSLLMQRGLSLYREDARSTTLSDSEVIEVFSEWTDYYTKLKLPVTMNFYNRFRIGTCPLGIDSYIQYNTLKAAAPEIEGLWNVAPIPGTRRDDGSISHTSSGGGTGCVILRQSSNIERAWEFLKWWTSEDIQLAYSNNVEAALGSTGRIAVANINAFLNMSWDSTMLDQILVAWDAVQEVPEIPGSYYTARSIDHSFWNVVNAQKNPKDMLLKWSKEVDDEIAYKYSQYENRGK